MAARKATSKRGRKMAARKSAVKKRAPKKAAKKRATKKTRAKRARKKAVRKTARKSPAHKRAGKKATKKRAARKKTAKKRAAAAGSTRKLYTLTEIGRLANVSMPTLQKYKRNHQDRIPSVGEGRTQRYPRKAVAVLKQLKQENLARRGRPPKGGRRKASAADTAQPKDELLTLTEIGRITKISYPTLSRYVKLFIDRIPHVGSGRKRRFPREAVAVFRQLRSESRPGRPPAAKKAPRRAARGDEDLGARIVRLEKAVADLVKSLKKPLQVTIRGR